MDVDGRRLVFVAGLHRSGTTPLAKALAAHPQIAGLTATGAIEDEGQHLQHVYPAALTYGGAGRFALNPAAHLTEDSPLVTPENAQALWDAWAPYWDLDRKLVLEKSPPNLVMGRFLQALFPGCAFVVVIRNPVIVTLSTKKWTRGTSLPRLMRNWVQAHRTFRADLPHLQRVVLLRYEDLVHDAAGELARVAHLLELDGPVPSELIQTSRSATYETRWADMATGGPLARRTRQAILRDYSGDAAEYGYDLADLDALGPRPELADLRL